MVPRTSLGTSKSRVARVCPRRPASLSVDGSSESRSLSTTSYQEFRPEEVRQGAQNAIDSKPDVIIAFNNSAVALHSRTKTVPIVLATVTDPVGLGLTSSLHRPDSNVTGLAWPPLIEINLKRLQMLREVAPAARPFGVLYSIAPNQAVFQSLADATRAQGVEMIAGVVNKLDDLAGAFDAFKRQGVEAVIVLVDPLTARDREQLARVIRDSGRPAVLPTVEYCTSGGLLCYGHSLKAAWARTAFFADRLLRGAKPADLPFEQPTKFELTVNMSGDSEQEHFADGIVEDIITALRRLGSCPQSA